MKYFYEKLVEDSLKIGYKVKKNIYSKKTKNNKIEVVENALLGKIFVLNGEINLIEKYEFAFSEMVAHSIMFSHPKPEKVLLIGEIDRGILKEVARHKNVNEVYFISSNKEAKEVFEKNFSNLTLKDDFKIKTVFDNPVEYINNFEDYFDVIIIDSKNADLRKKDFLKSAFRALTKEGMISLVSGSLKNALEVNNGVKLFKTIFRYPTVIRIPSTQEIFSDLGVILASKKINVSEISLRTLISRFKQFKEAKNLKYYSPEIYLSSLVIPKFYNIK